MRIENDISLLFYEDDIRQAILIRNSVCPLSFAERMERSFLFMSSRQRIYIFTEKNKIVSEHLTPFEELKAML